MQFGYRGQQLLWIHSSETPIEQAQNEEGEKAIFDKSFQSDCG